MLFASPWLDDLVPANGNILMLCEVALPFFFSFFNFRNHGTALFLKVLKVDKACSWSLLMMTSGFFFLIEQLPTRMMGILVLFFKLYE